MTWHVFPGNDNLFDREKSNNMDLTGLEGHNVGHDYFIIKFQPCYPSLHILDSIAAMDLYAAF